jgi:hypothetical protein
MFDDESTFFIEQNDRSVVNISVEQGRVQKTRMNV